MDRPVIDVSGQGRGDDSKKPKRSFLFEGEGRREGKEKSVPPLSPLFSQPADFEYPILISHPQTWRGPQREAPRKGERRKEEERRDFFDSAGGRRGGEKEGKKEGRKEGRGVL